MVAVGVAHGVLYGKCWNTAIVVNECLPRKQIRTNHFKTPQGRFFAFRQSQGGIGSAIARAEGLDPSTVNELLRLTLLAPDIIAQLMAGRQPRRLTLMWFQRNPLPVDWQAQRDIITNFQ